MSFVRPSGRCAHDSGLSSARVAARVQAFVRQHPRLIPGLQLAMVVFYLALIVVPPLLPAPAPGAGPRTSFVRFAQFAIWSIWWPTVLLSLLVFGRAWCGVLCPEGALAQTASRIALNRRVPRWMKWGGIPLAAFFAITSIGQLVEVDEHPLPQLLVLGGSTLIAIVVSLIFTRDSRVWCRYLCPVSLLFGVFSRLGAATFQVDRAKLESSLATSPSQKGRCPVLIHLPVMSTARDCLMCFGCAGWRDAIHLRLRRPGEELERVDQAHPLFWEVMFLFFGAVGLPLGVFYAEAFELEGALLLASLAAGSALAGLALSLVTALSARALRRAAESSSWREHFVPLAYAYAPLSLFSLFLGLSQPTFESAVAAGLPGRVVVALRALLLVAGAGWSLTLAHRMVRRHVTGGWRARLVLVPYLAGSVLVVAAWARVLQI